MRKLAPDIDSTADACAEAADDGRKYAGSRAPAPSATAAFAVRDADAAGVAGARGGTGKSGGAPGATRAVSRGAGAVLYGPCRSDGCSAAGWWKRVSICDCGCGADGPNVPSSPVLAPRCAYGRAKSSSDESSLREKYAVLAPEGVAVLPGGSRKGDNACGAASGEIASYDWFPRSMRKGEGEETPDEKPEADVERALPKGLRARRPSSGLSAASENGDSEREEGGERSSRSCS